MRKLTDLETGAVPFLARNGAYCPGEVSTVAGEVVRSTLDSLVKKKRATVEMTDDGPRYSLSAQGRADAS